MNKILTNKRIVSILVTTTFLTVFANFSYLFYKDKEIFYSLIRIIENSLSQDSETSFPEMSGPKKMTYAWTYQGDTYEISIVLYESLYKYYQAKPKSIKYYGNENEDEINKKYYEIYLKVAQEDKTFRELASLIKKEAVKNNLSPDETADLVLAFTQTIPYNTQLAADIKNGLYSGSKYPYEVLYEKGGVCGGKSFLATILFKELGYGTALFLFPNENHITAGIKCADSYSNFESSYCLAETTGFGHPIGIFNKLNPENNQSITKNKINPFNLDEKDNDLVSLSSSVIYKISEGLEYKKIVDNITTGKKIDDLDKNLELMERELEALNKTINANNEEISDFELELKNLKTNNNFTEYNKLVPKFNALLDKTQAKIDLYNSKVKEYNDTRSEINRLIDILYQK